MPTDNVRTVAIVGAGQAGSHAARRLRKRGFTGAITLIGNEAYLPYQRPPLSKAYLKGQIDSARVFLKPESTYSKLDIQLLLTTEAHSIATGPKLVFCEAGRQVRYDRLILATGSAPMRLRCSGAELEGVYSLRSLADATAIRNSLARSKRLVVIGGGYIGLEVAAAGRQLGLAVTVLERLPRLLSRVTTAPVSDYYLRLHRGNGVDVRLGATAVAINGGPRVTGVQLESGECIPAETVLVGIGVRPNETIAANAGIECDDGIVVDDEGLTSDNSVYAAGDCARRRRSDGADVRLESVHNALDLAERIAANIVGDAAPAFEPPWFWSDQYDAKLQTVGLFSDHSERLVHGNARAGKFSVLYFRDDQLVALDAVNDPASFIAGKKLLKRGTVVTRSEAASPGISLREICASQAR